MYEPHTAEQVLPEVIGSGIDVSVGSLEMLHLASAAAQQAERRARVHLKIDTGMGRNGAAPSLARDIGRTVRDDEFLQLVAAWTHLTSADDPADPATDQQVEVFDSTCEALADEVGPIPLQHIANSAALLSRPDLQDRKSTRLNSSHVAISYAVFCLKKKNTTKRNP